MAPSRNESEDCIVIDAEDYKATGYSSVPMFVQHTEAMMEEIDRMVNLYDLIYLCSGCFCGFPFMLSYL